MSANGDNAAKMSPIKVLHIINVDKQNYYWKNLAKYSDPGEVEYAFATLASAKLRFCP
jgi:hypothetical protein